MQDKNAAEGKISVYSLCPKFSPFLNRGVFASDWGQVRVLIWLVTNSLEKTLIFQWINVLTKHSSLSCFSVETKVFLALMVFVEDAAWSEANVINPWHHSAKQAVLQQRLCSSMACNIVYLLSLSHKEFKCSQRKESLTRGDGQNSVLSQWSKDFPGPERAASSPPGLLRALPCSQPLAAAPFGRYDKGLSIFAGEEQICADQLDVPITRLCKLLHLQTQWEMFDFRTNRSWSRMITFSRAVQASTTGGTNCYAVFTLNAFLPLSPARYGRQLLLVAAVVVSGLICWLTFSNQFLSLDMFAKLTRKSARSTQLEVSP